MCFLCDAYGDGSLWYLNPRNYARQMYKLRKPGEMPKGPEADPEYASHVVAVPWVEALEKGQEAFARVMQQEEERSRARGAGAQVLPLADAEKVMELASPIALMMCICRKVWRAIDERDERSYTCMGLGPGMLKWERWPERYKGGVRFVSAQEAKEWLRRMDQRGFVHILMPFGAPYIGGFCQCDYPTCLSLRNRLDFGLRNQCLKSHYVAMVHYDICNGCGVCVQRCQFGALKFEVTIDRPNIDMTKCFGCGLCETACPRTAIGLLERMSLPSLREAW